MKKKNTATRGKKARPTKQTKETGTSARPFTQLDTTEGGIVVTTPAAVKKRCQQAVQRANRLNAAKRTRKTKK